MAHIRDWQDSLHLMGVWVRSAACVHASTLCNAMRKFRPVVKRYVARGELRRALHARAIPHTSAFSDVVDERAQDTFTTITTDMAEVAKKEETKVDAELADEIDQTGWTYTYEWNASKDSYTTKGGMLVSPKENFKTSQINLFSLERPHMRGFHYAWLSFFMAFVCWFSFAPLMPIVRVDLGLNLKQVATVNIASVFSTVFARFIMGPLCEQLGPKRCQFMLLSWISFMVFLAPTVSNVATLAIVRCLIGFGGATFVVTQYWSSMLFTKDIVGLANATTAGWGNLGGGVTQNIMIALWNIFKSAGCSEEQAWRVSFIVPAVIVGVFSLILRFTSDDSPQGDYMPLMKAGIIEKKTAAQSFKGGFWNPNNWLLGVQYATCFGVELHVNNWAATYFKEVFEVSPTAAANMASVFGWMNLFCRSVGGFFSDLGNKHYGMQGRMWAQTLGLIGEGLLLIVFSKQTSIPAAMVSLVLFSSFVQATEGTSFGIVPYIDPKNTGAVCAVVGAWGNIGAVMWGFLFRECYIGDLRGGFTMLGVIIILSSVFTVFIKIHGHSSLLNSDIHQGYCTEEYIQKQDERIKALEDKTAELTEVAAKQGVALKQSEA